MSDSWILPTAAGYFAQWVQHYTHQVQRPPETVPAPTGEPLRVFPAAPGRGGQAGNRAALYIAAVPETEEGALQRRRPYPHWFPLYNGITLTLLPLDAARVEVLAQCFVPSLEPYYHQLCAAILARWEDQTAPPAEVAKATGRPADPEIAARNAEIYQRFTASGAAHWTQARLAKKYRLAISTIKEIIQQQREIEKGREKG